jgi:aerobic-type carbon monoxide dehydrogenase small subunit (CoxS/CutS family)
MTDLARHDGPTAVGSIPTTVDGVAVTLPVDGGRALADVLRADLGRYGTHLGCRNGDCGACTVLLDGEPYKSCLVPVGRVAGREVETLEGLDGPDGLHPVQEQFLAAGAFQCGFCLAGQVLCTVAALRREPVPDDLDAELDGNLCRCTGYQQISVAVAAARDRARAATGD